MKKRRIWLLGETKEAEMTVPWQRLIPNRSEAGSGEQG